MTKTRDQLVDDLERADQARNDDAYLEARAALHALDAQSGASSAA